MSANIQLFGLEPTINPGNQCNCGLLLPRCCHSGDDWPPWAKDQ